MTNEISIFNFKSTPVRTSTQDGEVWFCLVDVCDSLNLKRGSRVIDRLSEKGGTQNVHPYQRWETGNNLHQRIESLQTDFQKQQTGRDTIW